MEQKSNSALISSIIIVIIIVLGGIYIWKTSVKNKIIQDQIPNAQNTQPVAGASSTASIEQDLNGMDVNSLDKGL